MDAKEKINPAKAPYDIWCTLTRPCLHPAALRTLGGDVTGGWGRRASLCSGEGRDEATRGPPRPQRNHRDATAATLPQRCRRRLQKKSRNEENRMSPA